VDREREVFLEVLDYLARASGRWRGVNPEYTAGGRAPQFWGLEFEWSAGRHAVRGRILGIHQDGRLEEFWTLLSAWDPARRIGVHIQVSAAGVYADGQYVVVTPEQHEIFMRGYTPDHKRFTLRDAARVVGPDSFETQAFYLSAGEWKAEGSTRWTRVASFTAAGGARTYERSTK
jgi:hypothetical protein